MSTVNDQTFHNSFMVPLNAGMQSDTRAVARRLGKLLTALDNEITGHVVQGHILDSIVSLKRHIIEQIKPLGWDVTYSNERIRVKVPRSPRRKTSKPKKGGGGNWDWLKSTRGTHGGKAFP